MSKFVKLLISTKLMFEEFIIFLLKIMIIVIFARAIQRDFLHNYEKHKSLILRDLTKQF